MNQAIDKRTSGTAWSTKTLLGACLMAVATLLAACLMAAQPAHASTTFVVNSQQGDESDASSADALCKTSNGECTLRAAIQQANFTPGADTINFNAPGGFVSLHPTAPMPVITDAVTIDGYSQPGTHPNTLAKGATRCSRSICSEIKRPLGAGST